MSSSNSSSGLPVPESLLPYLSGQLKDDSSLQGAIVRFNITFAVLVAVTVGLRMVVRFGMIRAAGTDDVLMIIAVLSAYVLFSLCLVGAHFGLGIHIWNLDSNLFNLPAATARLTKILFVCYLAYATAITFVKCSIIASYIRVFPHANVRKISYATGFVVVVFWICQVFAICFTCTPIQALWDYSITDAKCFPVVDFFYAAAGVNIVTDIVLCILPLPTLWALRLPTAQKITVCILFSFGLFACIASIIRITELYNLTGVDVSYASVVPLNWSVAEVGTAIVCSCISTLRPLASKLLPNLFVQLSQPTNRSGGTYGTAKTHGSLPDQGSTATRHGSEETFELVYQRPEQVWPIP